MTSEEKLYFIRTVKIIISIWTKYVHKISWRSENSPWQNVHISDNLFIELQIFSSLTKCSFHTVAFFWAFEDVTCIWKHFSGWIVKLKTDISFDYGWIGKNCKRKCVSFDLGIYFYSIWKKNYLSEPLLTLCIVCKFSIEERFSINLFGLLLNSTNKIGTLI